MIADSFGHRWELDAVTGQHFCQRCGMLIHEVHGRPSYGHPTALMQNEKCAERMIGENA